MTKTMSRAADPVPNPQDGYVVRLRDLTSADVARVGGKNASLGELRRIHAVVATPCWCERRRSSRVSAGVFQARVLRGRLLRVAATAARSSGLCRVKSVPLGKYWRSRPLVFSLVPRCQGLCGSQK